MENTTRKPIWLFLLDGSFLLRFAHRTFRVVLFQEPPRNTRGGVGPALMKRGYASFSTILFFAATALRTEEQTAKLRFAAGVPPDPDQNSGVRNQNTEIRNQNRPGQTPPPENRYCHNGKMERTCYDTRTEHTVS